MENRLLKLENDVKEIQDYVAQLTKLHKSEESFAKSLTVHVESTEEFARTILNRVLEVEKDTATVCRELDNRISKLSSNVDRLIELTEKIISNNM